MPCYRPLAAWFPVDGGRPVFREPVGEDPDDYLKSPLPCGRCQGCLLRFGQDWAVRCAHEAQMHAESCFVTLTYDDAHLPREGVSLRELQLFVKRVREHFSPRLLRFFGVGEYGTRTGRAHYHVCLFGVDWSDRVPAGKSPTGFQMWSSKTLDALWQERGLCRSQAMTVETAAYAARYSLKKIGAARERKRQDPVTGEWFTLRPEFCTMSKRPGLGSSWLERFRSDVFPAGRVVLADGREVPPPRFYMERFAESDPEAYAALRERVALDGVARLAERLPRRLAVREAVASRRLELFAKREL